MNFILSRRELSKLMVMLIIATVAFGLSGLVMIVIMQWMTLQSFAEDVKDKHGIAELQSSRLGGIAVALGVLIALGFAIMFAEDRDKVLAQISKGWPIWLGAISCFLLGLIEDFRNNSLSPRVRIAFKALAITMVFILVPSLIPKSIGIWGVDSLLQSTVIAYAICIFFSVGFINAINTADGANGLVAGIFVFTFCIFTLEFSHTIHPAGLQGASLFLLFNIISGRLFLGDAGSYGIGAGLLFAGLSVLSEGLVSLPFLAALYFYPCFDFLVSIIRRRHAGRPITEPDNDHLHNRLYRFYRLKVRSRTLANSLTGLSLSGATSGFVLIIYLAEGIPLVSDYWWFIFVVQILAYFILFNRLSNKKPGIKKIRSK